MWASSASTTVAADVQPVTDQSCLCYTAPAMRLPPLALVLLTAMVVTGCAGGAVTPTASPTPGLAIFPGSQPLNLQTPFGGTQQPVHTVAPEFRTPEPGVPPGYHSFEGAQPLPDIPAGDAVYLSLGDSINYGCCADPQLSSHPRFAHYMSQKLNRPVVWISLAGDGTLQDFIHGIGGQTPQLDAAIALLQKLKGEGHDVVAISLSIGGNDLLALRTQMGCQGGGQAGCVDAFSRLVLSYIIDLPGVYARLNAAKDTATPVFQNTIYDAQDCGGPGSEITTSAVAVKVFNQSIVAAAKSGGATLVDFYPSFKGHACEYVSAVDPTYSGYDVILGLDKAAYDALPAKNIDPWKR
jgi:hypothetical protein